MPNQDISTMVQTLIKNPNAFCKGKTIKRIDYSACNCHVIYFTDDTMVMIETELVGLGYGPVWYSLTIKES